MALPLLIGEGAGPKDSFGEGEVEVVEIVELIMKASLFMRQVVILLGELTPRVI